MATTIKDLARETQLGFATISRYLNGKTVKKENRVKIEEAIEKLDYTINEYARGLRTSYSKSVGLIFTNVDDVFSSTIIGMTQKCLAQRGYSVILTNNSSDLAEEAKVIDFLIARKVDGVISFPIYPSGGAYQKFKKHGIPVVFLDSDIPEYGFDSIIVDNEDIGRRAAKLLLSQGHRDCGAVLGTAGAFTADLRLKGFADEFSGAGISLRDECLVRGRTDDMAGYEGVKSLLSLQAKPTAIFCTNYDITVGAIMALNDEKLEMGKDISLVGVDNLGLTRVIKPKLTLVSQPYRKISETGVEMLMSRIQDKFEGEGRKVVLPVEVCEGDTVRSL